MIAPIESKSISMNNSDNIIGNTIIMVVNIVDFIIAFTDVADVAEKYKLKTIKNSRNIPNVIMKIRTCRKFI